MIEICPFPPEWADLHQRLVRHARRHSLPEPPMPLILSGWNYSNDRDKAERWERMKHWAVEHGLAELIEEVPEDRMYRVRTPSTYQIGPLGGPLKLSWDFESKPTISKASRTDLVARLQLSWDDVAGSELCKITWPIALTGNKGRRLLVRAARASAPPWGDWAFRFDDQSRRQTFTRFRRAINQSIAPHKVDHVDFDVTDNKLIG